MFLNALPEWGENEVTGDTPRVVAHLGFPLAPA